MRRTISIAIALFLTWQIGSNAADPVGPKLTARLKELIGKEMQQVAQATSELALAIAVGDHARAAQLGADVRDSFILKKSLTEQDKKDLMGAVSPAFLVLDRRFHLMAGKLAEAAAEKNTELQGFYYSKMIEACIACHAQFATDRFPGLGVTGSDAHRR